MRLELGSVEEQLAHYALMREDRIDFLKTMCLLDATIRGSNSVAAAVSGGSQPQKSDSASKLIEALRKELLPGEEGHLEEKSKDVKRILEAELAKGPIHIRKVDDGSKQAKSKKRRG